MEKRRVFVVAAGVAAIGSVAALIPLGVYAAEEVANPQDTFIQKLASKLGIESTAVQEALDATHEELRAEAELNRQAEISAAVNEGTLTQRQADILNGISDTMEDLKPRQGTPIRVGENISELSEKLVNALNEAGLNTTLEEIESTREAAREAGIMGGVVMKFNGGRGAGEKFMVSR